jgi:hypothetical protein
VIKIFEGTADITQKVMKMIIFRCGKGLPFVRASGNEIAAASDTTPRMPVQPAIKILRDEVQGAACFKTFCVTKDDKYAPG